MDVYVELFADHVCVAEDDKISVLISGVDSFDKLYLKNDQFPCPWGKLVL